VLSQEIGTDGIRRLILDAGRGNALGAELLDQIAGAFDPERVVPGPVVLAARGRSFCTGLDLVANFELGREGMRELMLGFHRALTAVLLWPGPVVAEIQGHALAGGALLSLCADLRLMAHGSGRFGVHGAQLGVVYPQAAIEVLRWRLGRARAERLLYDARLRSGLEAFEEGLVDELVEPGELATRARELAVEANGSPGSYRLLKPILLREVAARLEQIDEAGQESWLDHWFSPATRQKLAAARASLLERQGPRPGETLD
jgi:enoyl-CoA hydratase